MTPSQPSPSSPSDLAALLKSEALDVIQNNIMPFWLKMQDTKRGGFYGQMRGDGTLMPDADKGGILNARILWSFSAAYRVLKKPEYLAAATRAKDYILHHFIDPVYGGTYWSLDCEGNPVDTKKQFYSIGFMIYGLSEYARAIGDEEALRVATMLFDTIEQHSLDIVYNGYIEACTRDWQPINDMRLSQLDANYPKSQNTHLHIIEPYANLYRALKTVAAPSLAEYLPKVEAALRNLIHIFTNRILNPESNHLHLFFDNDWTPWPHHVVSYGHDIECSWLLHEAALVLGDNQLLANIEPKVQLIAKASEKGLNADGSMSHEENLDTGQIDTHRHWWVQAETVVGFANIYQHFGSHEALYKAVKCWQYIKENLIDNKNGEWHWSCDKEGNKNLEDDKAGFWKCPYHNSRMCLELIERF